MENKISSSILQTVGFLKLLSKQVWAIFYFYYRILHHETPCVRLRMSFEGTDLLLEAFFIPRLDLLKNNSISSTYFSNSSQLALQ